MNPSPETFAQACERLGIEGTVDTIPAVAHVVEPDGTWTPDPDEPAYAGETRVCWDGQTTVADEHGRLVYWADADDSEYVWNGARMVEVVATTHHAVVPVGVRFPRIWQAIALLRSIA